MVTFKNITLVLICTRHKSSKEKKYYFYNKKKSESFLIILLILLVSVPFSCLYFEIVFF